MNEKTSAPKNGQENKQEIIKDMSSKTKMKISRWVWVHWIFAVIFLTFIAFVNWLTLFSSSTLTSVPPLAINLVNSSKSDITIDARAFYKLLEQVPTLGNVGCNASGEFNLIILDGKMQDFLKIPALSKISVYGYYREPESLLPFFKKGDCDIQIQIYSINGNMITGQTPFRLYKNWFEKYRLDIDVSK
jgi:hypothetical protein